MSENTQPEIGNSNVPPINGVQGVATPAPATPGPAMGGPGFAGPNAVGPGGIPKDDITLATLTHLSGIIHLLIMPLVVWLVKKDTSPYLADQAKETLNFHISLIIYHFVSGIALFFLCGVGNIMVWVFGLVLSIMAALAAGKGEYYRYPLCLRIVK